MTHSKQVSRTMIWAGMALSALLMGGTTARGQSGVTMYGSLANFDVQNNTGQEAYGFEIEIHCSMTGVGGTFNYNRYGAPQVVPFTGGVYVRYMAKWDPVAQQWSAATPLAVDLTPTNGHQCVLGTLNYQTSG